MTGQIIEFLIVVIVTALAVWAAVKARVYVAKLSASFYLVQKYSGGKWKVSKQDKVKFYIENIHRINSPLNYLMQLTFFCLMFLGFVNHGNYSFWAVLFDIVAAFLVATGQSAIASYEWQIWINRGNELPDIDDNESTNSEVVIGRKNFWIKNLKAFNGKKSKRLKYVGVVIIIIGVLVAYMF